MVSLKRPGSFVPGHPVTPNMPGCSHAVRHYHARRWEGKSCRVFRRAVAERKLDTIRHHCRADCHPCTDILPTENFRLWISNVECTNFPPKRTLLFRRCPGRLIRVHPGERVSGMRISNRSEGGRNSRTHGGGRSRRFHIMGWAALGAAVAIAATGCSSSSSTSTSGTPASSTSASSSSSSSATVPAVSIDSFTVNIASEMSQFKALAQAGTKGASSLQVGVVLPDTTSSTRWVDFDAPYFKQAFLAAGYTSSEFRIDNAQGSDATQLSLQAAFEGCNNQRMSEASINR
jgi:hypothetical protein